MAHDTVNANTAEMSRIRTESPSFPQRYRTLPPA
jgi:hypothetical protein